MKKLAIILAVILMLAACVKTETPTESVPESSESEVSAPESVPSFDEIEVPSNTVIIPDRMSPNTVIVYDEALNFTFLEGGYETTEDYETRVAAGAVDTDDPPSWWVVAEPNIKVEYDLHGEIQNIYYPSPYIEGDYQLERPNDWPEWGSAEWYEWIKQNLESALAEITLEAYPHSTEKAIENFKEYIRSLPSDVAVGILDDDQLVYSMLIESYWADEN